MFFYNISSAHCEIPCGIYGDNARFKLLREHIHTMEKSIKMIKTLSNKKDPESKNQLVRWVRNKEKHAKEFQQIIWQYFLTQRIKPVNSEDKKLYSKYLNKLEVLHKLSFYSMKVKQSLKEDNINKLKKLLDRFEKMYMNHNH